jgi:hypothetical protein
MPQLCVNVNKIALLRNSRCGGLSGGGISASRKKRVPGAIRRWPAARMG